MSTEKKVQVSLSDYNQIIKLTSNTLDIGEEFIITGGGRDESVIKRIRIVDDEIIDNQIIFSENYFKIDICVLVGNILYFAEKSKNSGT